MENTPKGARSFESPEEEIRFLRERHSEHEIKNTPEGKAITKEEVKDYVTKGIPESPAYQLSPTRTEEIVLKLKPETHDRKMEELLGILTERGIKSVLKIVTELDNAHL